MSSGVFATRDASGIVFNRMKELLHTSVLVGIPAEHNGREETGGAQTPGNAALLYIHEFGSPAANIPARPTLIPGVRKAEHRTIPALKAAARAALEGNDAKAKTELNRAGAIAVASVRNEIMFGDFVPLSPKTVANRWRHRPGAEDVSSRRPGERQYLAMLAQGVPPEEAQVAAGIHPLINTSQMLNAVTYVVKED